MKTIPGTCGNKTVKEITRQRVIFSESVKSWHLKDNSNSPGNTQMRLILTAEMFSFGFCVVFVLLIGMTLAISASPPPTSGGSFAMKMN